MGNAARKARKQAVRNGDASQQFIHPQKRPTRPYRDRQQREEDRRKEVAARRAAETTAGRIQRWSQGLRAGR